MTLFIRRYRRLAAAAALGLGAQAADAQQNVYLVGIVRGAGQPSLPADWTVKVKAVSLPGAQEYQSSREIYALPAGGPGSVRVVFGAEGYQLIERSVTIPAGRAFVRFDETLPPRLLSQAAATTRSPADLRAELDQQAALAERAGPEFVELFRWNLQVYERAYRSNAVLKGEIDSFQARRDDIASPQRHPQITSYRQLIEREVGTQAPIASESLLPLLDVPDVPTSIRARIIRALARSALSATRRADVLAMLRRESVNAPAPVAMAAVEALALQGEDSDRDRMLTDLGTTSGDRASVLAVGVARARLPRARTVLEARLRAATDAEGKLAAIEGLRELPDAASARSLLDAASREPDLVVKSSILETVHDMPIDARTRADVDRARAGVVVPTARVP